MTQQSAERMLDIAYGSHERQVLDLHRAPCDEPTPAVFFLHGGGWVSGDKTANGPDVARYLDAGISVVTVNYRYTWQAQLLGVDPPVSAPLADAARALQFVRSQSSAWNIEKTRIGAAGVSAGGYSSLWLALHPDMADPDSDDPVARESTRVACAAVDRAQTTLDPKQLRDWTPNSRYAGHAFGFTDPRDLTTRDSGFEAFLEARERLLPAIREYSPIYHANSDNPPVYLRYADTPDRGRDREDPTHTANLGLMLHEALVREGVESHLVYRGSPDDQYASLEAFMIEKLSSR